jgi:DNA modification methylase
VFGDAEVLEGALRAASEEQRLTHGFHTYPAGLHPDAARDLIARYGGARILDPFCGGGTTLVEARVAGSTAIGRDLSPVALRVARARTATPPLETIQRYRSTARKLTEAARSATALPARSLLDVLGDWYAPCALKELESLRAGIAEAEPAVRDLLWTTFSSILVKVSWRVSDTSNRREKHRRPPGTTAVLFHKKARELGRRMEALAAAVPEGTPDADIASGDARVVRTDAPVDLVVTSPPYPSTYDYLPLQHLRNIWLPDPMPDFDLEIGPRRAWRRGGRDALREWRTDTEAWMAAATACLRPGGHLVIVIGDGLAPKGPIDSARPTEQIASKLGLVLEGRASIERPDHARGTSRWEHALAFRR